MVSDRFKQRTMADFAFGVAKYYNITTNELKGPSRKRVHTIPRFVFCYLVRKHTKKSLTQIAAFLDGRDHTTILHAVRSAEERKLVTEELYDAIERIIRRKKLAIELEPGLNALFGKEYAARESV